jgi:hypothetical protein
VTTTRKNQLDVEEQVLLKLDGETYGEIDEKLVKLDFDQKIITFNVSDQTKNILGV